MNRGLSVLFFSLVVGEEGWLSLCLGGGAFFGEEGIWEGGMERG